MLLLILLPLHIYIIWHLKHKHGVVFNVFLQTVRICVFVKKMKDYDIFFCYKILKENLWENWKCIHWNVVNLDCYQWLQEKQVFMFIIRIFGKCICATNENDRSQQICAKLTGKKLKIQIVGLATWVITTSTKR